MDVHLVIDNYAAHNDTTVQRRLAERPRLQVHYTPTYASWLNQVEIRFNLIAITKITAFVAHYNLTSQPFIWTATAESTLQKIERLCAALLRTRH